MCGAKKVKNILKRELEHQGIDCDIISDMKDYEMMALLSWMLSNLEADGDEIKEKAAECALRKPPAYLSLKIL